MGSVLSSRVWRCNLVIIFQFLNYSKRNARQPGQLPDSCPKGKSVSYYVADACSACLPCLSGHIFHKKIA